MRTIKSLRSERTAAAHSFMRPQREQRYITDNDVSVPPALYVTDERNDVWTFGYDHIPPAAGAPRGEFAFRVVRNGADTGEFASRIERSSGRIRIFTRQGWKRWTGSSFV
jgi:hypothetical protein